MKVTLSRELLFLCFLGQIASILKLLLYLRSSTGLNLGRIRQHIDADRYLTETIGWEYDLTETVQLFISRFNFIQIKQIINMLAWLFV